MIKNGQRKDDEYNESDMSIIVTGGRLPISVVAGGLVAVFTTIVFAIIWLTKLDDRVLDNSIMTGQNNVVIKEHEKIISGINQNIAKQSVILDIMIKRVNILEGRHE